MATVPGTHKDRSSHELDKRPEGESHQPNQWIGVVWLVLVLLGLFAFVAWLASMAPESTGSSDLQYWMMP
ncbi:MAG: hypothetical protein HQ582_18900 [Planctomycetes bacterium]|nr:hypothetical protein [Planctomycetota bacterium]